MSKRLWVEATKDRPVHLPFDVGRTRTQCESLVTHLSRRILQEVLGFILRVDSLPDNDLDGGLTESQRNVVCTMFQKVKCLLRR